MNICVIINCILFKGDGDMKKIFSIILALVLLLGAMPLTDMQAVAESQTSVFGRAYAPYAPLTLSVKPSTTYASTYSTITATASYSGGNSPYLFAFYAYKDGSVVYRGAYTRVSVFKYMPTSAGRYTITCFLKDAAGTIKIANTPTILVTGSSTPPLFVLPSISKTSMFLGDNVVVSAKASGGAGGPYKYAFYIHKDTQLIYRGGYTTSNVLNYTPTGTGAYKFTAFAMDKSGARIGRSTKILSVLVPKYRALVIGQHQYWDHDLAGTDVDANNMNYMFLNKGPYGAMAKVTKRQDVPGRQILSLIPAAFIGADNTSVSIFYYSGHGSSNGYISGVDNNYIGSGAVSATELATALKKIPGKIIVILDSCFSGYHINRSTNVEESDFNKSVIAAFDAVNEISRAPGELASSKFHVITAARKIESSWGNYTGGYFTNGLIKATDINNNGLISMYEAYLSGYAAGVNKPGTKQYAQCYPSNDQLALWKK